MKNRILHITILALCIAESSSAQLIRDDLWVTNGHVRAFARNSTTLFVGGSFSQVGPHTGSAALLNNTSGGRITPWPKTNGPVYAVVSDGDGGWYIGGSFSAVGGVPRANLAYILSNGTVATWNPGADNTVYALALSGANVVAGGDFQNIGGQLRPGIAAIRRADGVPLAWDVRANGRIRGFVVDAFAGRIYVHGEFSSLSPINLSFFTGPNLALIDLNGVIQRSYNPIPNGPVYAAALASGGLFIGGTFSSVGGRTRQNLALVDSGGAVQGYSVAVNGPIYTLSVAGALLYVGGGFSQIAGVTRNGAAALFTAFSQASGWDPNVTGTVHRIFPTPSGIYLAGTFTAVRAVQRNNLARVDTNGTLASWNPNANAPVYVVHPHLATVFVGGEFTSLGGVARNNLAAIDLATGAATSWNPNVTGGDGVDALALSGTSLYVGGSFTNIGGSNRTRLGAVSTASGLPLSFNPLPDNAVHTIAVRAGKVYIGGSFNSVGVFPRSKIAEIDSATGAATAWNPGANGDVFALTIDSDTLYAGGTFSTIGGQARSRVAALNISTGQVTSWNPVVSGGLQGEFVRSIEIGNSVIYFGGLFGSVGGQTRAGVAAVDKISGAPTAFTTTLTNLQQVDVLYRVGNTLYVGGSLGSQSGESDLISVNAQTGARITSWDPKVKGSVQTLSSSDTTLFIGGGLSLVLNENREYLAGVYDSALYLPVFSAAPTSLQFGNVRVGEAKVETLRVTNTGGGVLSLSQIASSNPAFIISPQTAQIGSGQMRACSVVFTPPATGEQTGTLVFTHNAGTGTSRVALNGFGVSSQFAVTPNSISFGNVLINTTRSDSVLVTNNGNAVLNISSVTSSNPRFGVAPASAQIAPGDSRRFTISFMPNTTGNTGGSITFAHDAPGSPSSVVVAGTGVAPAIDINRRIIPFGNVAVNSSAADSFVVRNTGSADLSIISTTVTNARFSVAPTSSTIPPLGAQVFRVTFLPIVPGAQNGHIILRHNVSTQPDTLVVSGTGVTPVFQVDPSSLNFGNVLLGTVRTDSLIIRNTGVVNLRIFNATSSNPRFTLSPTSGVVPPNGTLSVHVVFAPTLAGSETGTLTFTHDGQNSPATIPVQGTGIVSGFLVAPTRLTFGDLRTGQVKSDTLTVTNTGSATLNISNVQSSNAVFTVNPASGSVAPGASRVFIVTFRPVSVGTFSGSVIFTHDAPGTPTSVPVSGNGVEPVFSVTPSSRAFGNVVLNSSRLDSVVIVNSGGAALNITSIVSSSSEFAVLLSSLAVPAGQQRTLFITFTPVVAGARNGTITFTHDAAGSPSVLPVSGTGIAATFSITPSQLNFGNVRVGQARRDSFIVRNTGNTELNINSAVSLDPQFSVTPSNGRIAVGGSLTFMVDFAPTGGSVRSAIVITHTAQGSPTSIDVQGVGIAPRFLLSRESVSFGNVRVGTTPPPDTVKVRNVGDDTLRISNIRFTASEFNAVPLEATIPPGGEAQFFLTFSPMSPGNVSGTALFDYNGLGSPARLLLSGNGIVAVVTLLPATLQFGEVGVGSSSLASFRIVNNGAASLGVDSLRMRGRNAQEFSIAGSQGPFLPLAPRESLRVNVRFTPQTVEQAKHAVLLIHHDAGAFPDSVHLFGAGRSSFVQVVVMGDSTVGGQVSVTATPPDGFVPTTAQLFYRETGRRTYASVPLTPSGQSYAGAIPASALTVRGVQYYVLFSNQNQTITNPEIDPVNNPAVLQVRVDAVTSAVALRARQYAMVSFPLELAMPTPRAQLADDYGPYNPAQWRFFRWEGDRYAEFEEIGDSLKPGLGFWLVTNSGVPFTLRSGRSVFPRDPYPVTLRHGWNQIASPFAFTIDWRAIENSSGLRFPVAWDGVQYQPNRTRLDAWTAYFVENRDTTPVTLLIRPQEALEGLERQPSTTDYALRIAARGTSPEMRDEFNFIGFAHSAATGDDVLDTPEPPAIQQNISLSALEGRVRYITNFKPLPSDGAEWLIVVKGSERNQSITISLYEGGTLPAGFSVALFDEETFTRVFPVQGSFLLRISDPSRERVLRVVIGTEQFIRQQSNGIPLQPVAFELSQNFPNPFNPTTSIRFSIGERSVVKLDVFDLLGRHVKNLLNEERLTGTYTLEWNGTTDKGVEAGSGVYYLRLRAGGFSSTRKMLLIR